MDYNITVIGSINMDLTLQIPRFPDPGETIIGNESRWAPGGKGANQALAARRAGSPVRLIGAVGDDALANSALELLEGAEIDLSEIRHLKDASTGLALIEVANNGENRIVVTPGSNFLWSPEKLPEEWFKNTTTVILQNEIPQELNARIMKECRRRSITSIYNPAPMTERAAELISLADILVVNETEGAQATGIEVKEAEENPEAVLENLAKMGPRVVVLTLGSRGALAWKGEKIYSIPAFKVSPTDTTAAGDTYIGYLASHLRSGNSLEESCLFASAAAALAVQKPGAQTSVPSRNQVEEYLGKTERFQ